MRTRSERRRTTFLRGHRAELAALVFLIAKGYRPLARRFAVAGGEVDLVVARGKDIVFVEVKARSHLDEARNAITATKRRRFSRAVRAWIARHPKAAGKTWRADAIFIAPWSWPHHVVAAFEIEAL
ncbi:YraN family protein [Microvirga massiliensis]|uniref:YraN family protein n=1 Tax=Microvirga massiliensis TaxID=1033741 RepID=UPI00062B766C|nr:YraN family protein [Microvirga massiliensis]